MQNWVFLCSLDNLLQKNVIVFFFENQISKWCSFEKRAIFDLLFTFFSYQGKVTKIPLAHISLTYMYFALRVGESPTREGPGYATGHSTKPLC